MMLIATDYAEDHRPARGDSISASRWAACDERRAVTGESSDSKIRSTNSEQATTTTKRSAMAKNPSRATVMASILLLQGCLGTYQAIPHAAENYSEVAMISGVNDNVRRNYNLVRRQCAERAASASDLAHRIESGHARASIYSVIWTALTALVGTTTGATTSYLAATSTNGDNDTAAATVGFVGAVATAALAIPATLSLYYTTRQSGDVTAARAAVTNAQEHVRDADRAATATDANDRSIQDATNTLNRECGRVLVGYPISTPTP